jgi:two-component system, NtrC family, sensor histidine kinase PilS
MIPGANVSPTSPAVAPAPGAAAAPPALQPAPAPSPEPPAAQATERRAGDRRAGDRRAGGRRQAAGRRREDSLFGAFAASDSLGSGDSFFDPGWMAAGDRAADSRFVMRQARRAAQAQDSALARVYRTYAAARAVIGFGLVAAQGVGNLFGARSSEWLALVSVAYAVQAITLWLLPRFGTLTQPQPQPLQRRRQWLATIGVDLLAFTLLHVLAIGSTFNFTALLVLPVLMSGVLTSRLLALGTAAGRGADAAGGGLAIGARRRRCAGPDAAVGAGRTGPVHHHPAGR